MAAEVKHQTKKMRISKAQQMTMLEVLVASLILGTCLVLAIFLIKYIVFNTKVITAKGEAISEYDQTLRNVGVCKDDDGNGRLNGKELSNCDPNSLSLDAVKGSLRYNVISAMAENKDLESVARQREADCYDADGNKIDFNKLYENTSDEAQKQQYLQLTKVCSALRVIPDALPAQRNTEALMASLNKIFILSNWEPEALSPIDDMVASPYAGLGVIPTSVRIEGIDGATIRTLINLERSIRDFDVSSAVFEWTNAGVSAQVATKSYYLDTEAEQLETKKTVKASDKVVKSSDKGDK